MKSLRSQVQTTLSHFRQHDGHTGGGCHVWQIDDQGVTVQYRFNAYQTWALADAPRWVRGMRALVLYRRALRQAGFTLRYETGLVPRLLVTAEPPVQEEFTA